MSSHQEVYTKDIIIWDINVTLTKGRLRVFDRFLLETVFLLLLFPFYDRANRWDNAQRALVIQRMPTWSNDLTIL